MANTFPATGDLHGWAQFLGETTLPILTSTQNSLSEMKLTDDTLLPSELSVAILRDPLFTVSILRHLQKHRNKLRTVDITTIEHALMMLGVEPFFRQFGQAPTISELMVGKQIAVEAILKVARRSYVASRLAQDWAAKSMDIESEEIQVASLIHDVAEMLLWIRAPGHAFMIRKIMAEDPSIRSLDAQHKVIGVSLVDVEIEICHAWGLPELLIQLLRDQSKNHRMNCVSLAVKIARHSANGWDNPALPDDWTEAAALLGQKTPEAAAEKIKPFVEIIMDKWDRHNHQGCHESEQAPEHPPE